MREGAASRLCSPLSPSDPYSFDSLYAGLIGLFQGQVQYNGQGVRLLPSTYFSLSRSVCQSYAATPLCTAMMNVSLGSPLQRLAAIAGINDPEDNCYAYSYKNDIAFLSETHRDSSAVVGGSGLPSPL